MCMGCYERYGSPTVDNELVRKMATRLRDADPYGALHIVVDDWNLDDVNIKFCQCEADASKQEVALASDLLKLSLDERVSAMAIADGYWQPNPTG